MTVDNVWLGRRLFFDKNLSADRAVACATCHRPERAFTDGRRLARGVFGREGNRNTPSLVNRVFGRAQFLDGRSATLEEQVLEPVFHNRELGLTERGLEQRLREGPEYHDLTVANVRRALASFIRSVLAGDAPVDRYYAGNAQALSPMELAGLAVFRGKGNCATCHGGPTFSDERFHNTGIAWRGGVLRDVGRSAVTKRPADHGAFKTPTLREVARTAPYMHDGSLPSLEAVIDFYDRGGNRNPYLDSEIRPLRLTRVEKRALAAFLGALSGFVSFGCGAA
jgi:cytochrome c peroxidase